MLLAWLFEKGEKLFNMSRFSLVFQRKLHQYIIQSCKLQGTSVLYRPIKVG